MSALSVSNDTERFRHVMTMLDHVTPQNWPDLWRVYLSQTLEEGRLHDNEWTLFMSRVGEVAGADAMAYFEVKGQPESNVNRWGVLQGWASARSAGGCCLDAKAGRRRLQPRALVFALKRCGRIGSLDGI